MYACVHACMYVCVRVCGVSLNNNIYRFNQLWHVQSKLVYRNSGDKRTGQTLCQRVCYFAWQDFNFIWMAPNQCSHRYFPRIKSSVYIYIYTYTFLCQKIIQCHEPSINKFPIPLRQASICHTIWGNGASDDALCQRSSFVGQEVVDLPK